MLVHGFFAGMMAVAALVDPPVSPVERIRAIKDDVAAAQAAYSNAFATLRVGEDTNAQIEAAREVLSKKQDAGIAGAFEIAEKEPETDAGFEALEWLLLNAPRVYATPAGKPALELMKRYYAADARMGRAGVLTRIAIYPPYGLLFPPDVSMRPYAPEYQSAMDLLKAVMEKNTDRCARGQALLGLALQAKRAYLFNEYKKRPGEGFKAEAEKKLEEVIKSYEDCPCGGDIRGTATIGERARTELFEIQNLRPGLSAPEIAGMDLNGGALKLSEYRGKVVLLVFWASWCGPCMGEVPHELELVKRFAGRPFAVVGVNCDEDKAKALAAVAKEKMPWRSFWNGPYGPINTAWNIHFLPTIYVVDEKGVIVAPCEFGAEMDGVIEKLVARAEMEKSEQGR